MTIALALPPGPLQLRLKADCVAIGVVISGLLSVALALSAMPALLRVLGPTLNRWEIRLPRSRREGSSNGEKLPSWFRMVSALGPQEKPAE